MDEAHFSEEEQTALHSLAEIFQDKDTRDELRRLLTEGTTLREIVFAYKANRRFVSSLKAVGGLIVVVGGAVTVLRGFPWPK